MGCRDFFLKKKIALFCIGNNLLEKHDYNNKFWQRAPF